MTFIQKDTFYHFIYILTALFSFGGLLAAADSATNNPFSRGVGYWTTPTDRRKTGFFEKLTPHTSQCENWYQVNSYVAEFWCTMSSAPILATGVYFRSPELIIAGAASTVSHAIPKNWLLQIDKIAAIIAASKVIRTYPVLLKNPWLIVPLAGVVAIGAVDALWGRKHGTCIPHVLWHCAAVAAGGLYLSYC